MGATLGSGLVYCVVLVLLCMTVPSLGTDCTVGDSAGWAMGVDYSTWTGDKTFKVGDNLVFNYGGGHTVDEVSKSDYSSCTPGNSMYTDSSGATTIPLETARTHYFICGAIGHCSSGMKLAVKVAAADSTTPTASPSSLPVTTAPTTDGSTIAPTSGSSTTTTSPPASTGGNTKSTANVAESSWVAVSPSVALVGTLIALFVMIFC